jgi:hypothetical protein
MLAPTLDPAIGEDDAGKDLRAAEVDADDAFPVQTARLPYWLTEASSPSYAVVQPVEPALDSAGNDADRGLQRRSDACPGRGKQHAHHNHGKNQRVLHERLPPFALQAREQHMCHGHSDLPAR